MKKDKLYTVDKGLASVLQKHTGQKNLFALGDALQNKPLNLSGFEPQVTKQDLVGLQRKIDQANSYQAGNGNTAKAINYATSVLGPMAANYISDGYTNGAANQFMAAGNAIGSAVGMVNPVAGAIVTGLTNVVGGLGNRAFGIKENKENVAAIKQNTQQAQAAGSALAQSSTSGDFIANAGNMVGSSGFSARDLYRNGWFTNKGTRKGNALLRKENSALAMQGQGMMVGANNVDSNLDDNIFGNFRALGGPMEEINNHNMGAIEYGLMSDYLIAKNRQNDTKNKIGGISPMPMMNGFAEGGKIEIKHPGRLTALKKRTGKTEAELYNDGNPAHKKMVVFARNSRRWKKAYGGFIDAANKLADVENNLYALGGDKSGGFSGAGAGGSWEDTKDTYPEVKDFNEAFDKAIKAGLPEFLFQGRRYNTKKEHNPVREYNNRWVGAGRRSDVKNPSKAYDHQTGPIGGPLSLIPIVTDTYIGSPDRPYRLEYDPNATEKLTSPFRSYAMERPKKITPKKAYGGTLFALGGDIQSHGADWSTGMSTIGAGGSHSENPYEGVQVGVDSEGTPNLVEENETIYNDYVYSNRIEADQETLKKFHLPKKAKLTYADITKRLEKEIKERPNDPLSKAAFKAQMESLAEEQERQKKEMEAARAREAFEALSPEEQTALMQQMAQQDQMAQEQAMQEQANLAAEQQGTVRPEEAMAMEASAEQMPTQPMEGQYAEGGKLNLYPWGGIEGLFNVTPPYAASKTAGFIPYTRDLTDEEVIKREQDPVFQAWTNYVNSYWDNPNLDNTSRTQIEGYLKALDAAAGGNHLFDANGNILPTAKDYYNHARTGNHKWGYYHLTPEQIAEEAAKAATSTGNPNVFHSIVGDDDYHLEDELDWSKVGKEVRRETLPNGDTVIYHQAVPSPAKQDAAEPDAATTPEERKIVPVHRDERLRYAGLFGPAAGLLMQGLGIGKPNTKALDGVIDAYDKRGAAIADYQPIGNYLRFRPMDIWAEQNRLNANARATDRAIANSGSNQGSKMAGLLANEYNNQIGSGQLYRQALEYNDALRERVAAFNRGTDQFNAEAYNRTALQNAEVRNRDRQYRAQLGMQAAMQKAAQDAAWNQGIYGNVAGLFKGIGDLGRENYQHNRIADMAATGIFGTIKPETFVSNGYLQYADEANKRKKKVSKGGRINKRKGGLTY